MDIGMTEAEREKKGDILTYFTVPKKLYYELTEHIFMRKVNINSIKTAHLFTITLWKCLVLIMMTFYFNQYFQICCNSWSLTSGEQLAPHYSTIANTGNYKPNFCFSYYFRCNPKLRGSIWGCWWRGVDNWIHSQEFQVITANTLLDLPELLSPHHFLIHKIWLLVPWPGDCY